MSWLRLQQRSHTNGDHGKANQSGANQSHGEHTKPKHMRGFGIANYRSFSSEGAWFPDLSKINIFIGKNNAGKSNVLKFLRDLGEIVRGNRNSKPLETIEHKHWSEGDPPAIDLVISLAELGLGWGNFGIAPHRHNLKPPEQTSLCVRFDPVNRGWGEIDPFASLQDNKDAYVTIWQGLGAKYFPPAKDQVKKLLNNQQWQHHVSRIIQNEFKDVFYVQQFREIRDGDGKTEEQQVAGYKLAERLGVMKSPGEKRNVEQEQFYQIRDWIRELLDLPDLDIDIEHPGGEKPNAVLLKTNGLRRYLESFGTGIHQLVILCFAISLKKKHICMH